MRRTVEKLGFKLEGVDGEIHHGNKEWVDRLTFGVQAKARIPSL